jgi:hypothetical protein
MKTKHTPGPYVAIVSESERHEIHTLDGETIVAELKPQNRPEAEAQANTKLFAAAPEMLRECEFALEMINSRAQVDKAFSSDTGYRNFKHRLETVIRKAKGEK